MVIPPLMALVPTLWWAASVWTSRPVNPFWLNFAAPELMGLLSRVEASSAKSTWSVHPAPSH